jgi:hypothetical protein
MYTPSRPYVLVICLMLLSMIQLEAKRASSSRKYSPQSACRKYTIPVGSSRLASEVLLAVIQSRVEYQVDHLEMDHLVMVHHLVARQLEEASSGSSSGSGSSGSGPSGSDSSSGGSSSGDSSSGGSDGATGGSGSGGSSSREAGGGKLLAGLIPKPKGGKPNKPPNPASQTNLPLPNPRSRAPSRRRQLQSKLALLR